jgi:ubiquinone/menaquinone biosynthesis C-methylase UbiE
LVDHNFAQRREFDTKYVESRSYWLTSEPMTSYVTLWRLSKSIKCFQAHAGGSFSSKSRVLFLCAGDGAEASACCDTFGLSNVTFSDISPVAISTGLRRDSRLLGFAADAENTGLKDASFDLVIVQDGLHHLRNPIRGFTEMLRIARLGVIFIEPHDSLVGRLIGTKWERHGDAINYVFRWTKRLVQQIASSYLGYGDVFMNVSFSYWHHNVVYARLGDLVGKGRRGIFLVGAIKFVLDHLFPFGGNQLSGIILKRQAKEGADHSCA